ncbi:MAG: ABC transporter permease [Planctomycetota bacterium]|jgi:putative ABC transport system permease protein
MSILGLAWRSLRQRPLSSVLTCLSVALGVALVIAVLLLEREARNAYRRTALGVEVLVAGNKGSRIDALLATLYHVGRAPGRVTWSYYEELKRDKAVAYALPLAVGDNYRGFPVVGTTAELFTSLRPRPGVSFELDGRAFGGKREAVAGSRTGLSVGDTFHPSHGAFEHKDETFTVVGVTRATGTAHDKAIWIDVHDFLHMEGHVGMERHDHEHDAVSAVLLKTKSGSPLVIEPLIKRINDGNEAQAIRPVQVVGELMGIVGDAQKILSWIGALVVVVAALSVSVALYNSMAERRSEIGVLRALGARRSQVFAAVLLEASLICGAGALVGIAIGHGGALLAAPLMESRAGVRFEAAGLLPHEPLFVLVLVGLGCVAGVLPAMSAYRVDVARALE